MAAIAESMRQNAYPVFLTAITTTAIGFSQSERLGISAFSMYWEISSHSE